MPVDDYGIRADIVVDPASPFSRMNPGQLYEQAINRTSEFVRRRLVELIDKDPQLAIKTLFDYINDIHPSYAQLVSNTKHSHDKAIAYVRECIADGIYLNCPPSLKTINVQLPLFLQKKWGIPVSPVTYSRRDFNGNYLGTFRTKNNVCIGSKYILLLCKIPDPTAPGVAHTSIYNTPMKPSGESRLRHPISYTPIRFGEDELRIRNMDIRDTRADLRFMCLQSGSQLGVNKTIERLLTDPHPTNIENIDIDTETLIRSNSVISLNHHMMQTMGIDSLMTNTFDPPPDIGSIAGYEDDETDEHKRDLQIHPIGFDSGDDLVVDVAIRDDDDTNS